MSVYRANRNLTKMTDAQLNDVVLKCVRLGVDFLEVEQSAKLRKEEGQYHARKAVLYASAAIDKLDRLLTVSIYIEPSPESKMWSNMEGGHTFHKRPDLESILFN